ncbi:MAG TPA: hypothetical protein VF136_09125, partial [Methylomirabilota bacterium]
MRRLLAGAALLCFVAVGVAHADGPAPPPVGGLLARAVLLAGPPLTAGDLPAELSPADRDRLLAYLERRQQVGASLGAAAGDAG